MNNTIRIYPRKIRESFLRVIQESGSSNAERRLSVVLMGTLILALILAYSLDFFSGLQINPLLSFIPIFFALQLFFYFNYSLKGAARLKKIEEVFPDVIQLMSSNLRAGMTIDRAFILSARPEFYPLDEEILKAGKEITTGKDVASAMMDMSKRIGSEKIAKTMMLIISGIKAGGNLSTLLEQTASNMREKEFLEKRASSNVLMYVIFIFFAVGIGAPILFGLSSILVEVIITIVKTLPNTSGSQISLPFSFRDIGLSTQFIVYFSVVFVIVTDIISSLVIGLVNTGSEKSGLKYLIPLLILSLSIFFVIRIVLGNSLVDNFTAITR
jgi:flagellar protein FlaJ